MHDQGIARHAAANRELVLLYWSIGRDILARQATLGWGANVVERLAADLLRAFPGAKGFSARNLKYMRDFAEAWPDEDFVQQAAARLQRSWSACRTGRGARRRCNRPGVRVAVGPIWEQHRSRRRRRGRAHRPTAGELAGSVTLRFGGGF